MTTEKIGKLEGKSKENTKDEAWLCKSIINTVKCIGEY